MIEDRVLRVRIAASPQPAWAAVTDPAKTSAWCLDSEVRTTWHVGTPLEYDRGEELQMTGMLLADDPPWSFTHEFIAAWTHRRMER